MGFFCRYGGQFLFSLFPLFLSPLLVPYTLTESRSLLYAHCFPVLFVFLCFSPLSLLLLFNSGGDNQKWKIALSEDGTSYYISNAASSMCISGAASGDLVQQECSQTEASQHWLIEATQQGADNTPGECILL